MEYRTFPGRSTFNVLLKIQRLQSLSDKVEVPMFARSTLFADLAIFVSGT